MASTDVTNVGGDTPFDDGDNLSETAFREALAQTNLVDYVIRGCGFSVDFGANTLDIGNTNTRGNFAVVTNNNLAYPIFPDQATGISLPNTNGVNHVFIHYDAANDEIDYHVDDDDSAPTGASLKIGTVDTSSNSSTELNREPANRGSSSWQQKSIDDTDSTYNAADNESLWVNASAALVNVQLPSPSQDTHIRTVAEDANNTITIQRNGAESINGKPSNVTLVQNESVTLESDGSDWWVV